MQFCAKHYGFGGFEFSFEDLPPMTIDHTLERTLGLIKPVNQAIEHRRGHSPDAEGCFECRTLLMGEES